LERELVTPQILAPRLQNVGQRGDGAVPALANLLQT
jgi:hypothetical protein